MKRLFKSIHESKIYNIIQPTSLEKYTLHNNTIWLKREDTLPIFSFKLRGAYHKISSLSNHHKNGIIACSAGNHAQGVAYSSKILGMNSTIVMPEVTPKIKINAVQSYGANVCIHGKDFDEAKDYALDLSKTHNLTMIHPYDDYDVIAGQGTVGKEILYQFKKTNTNHIDLIFCPVGGGGLISGIANYFKVLQLPTQIIGVESTEANAMTQSIQQNKRVLLNNIGTFADGIAVKQIGKIPFEICKHTGIQMINVDNDEICTSIRDLYNMTRNIMEPAGAVAMAGCKSYIENNNIKNKNIVVISSGANMDFNRLRYISERSDHNEYTFKIEIPEKTGSFLQLYKLIYPLNITQFSYQYSDPKIATIIISVQIDQHDIKTKLQYNLSQYYNIIDKTNDNIFMDHYRYMLPISDIDQYKYQFEFPERPGELLHFLNKLDQGINITLFHYRNYGSEKAKVLVGFHDTSLYHIENTVQQLGYKYTT